MKTHYQLIREVATALTLPVNRIDAIGLSELNTYLDTISVTPVLAVLAGMQGEFQQTDNSKGYSNSSIAVWFLAAPANNTEESREATEKELLALSYQFFARWLRLVEFTRVPENSNTSLAGSYSTRYRAFDADLVGVQLTFKCLLDLSLPLACD